MKRTSVIPLILINLTNYPLPVGAKLIQTNSKPINDVKIYFAQQPQFPDNGAPTGRRRGGTSRDGCPTLSLPITALVPGEETLYRVEGATSFTISSKSFLTSTVSEYPSFLFYVPALPKSIHKGEFVLQDKVGDDVYRIPLSLPQKPGIINIDILKSSQYPLQLNEKYHWYFKVYCEGLRRTSDYFFVDGWVQRVPITPKLQNQLNKSSSATYMVYATHNLWYDAITHLADLRYTNSHSNILAKDWAELLKSVGLQDLTGASIVKHYNQLPTKM